MCIFRSYLFHSLLDLAEESRRRLWVNLSLYSSCGISIWKRCIANNSRENADRNILKLGYPLEMRYEMNLTPIICKMTCVLVLLAFGIIGSSALAASNPTCPAGTILCNGTCTDTSLDLLNCGSCGNACPDGTACVKGNCSCLVGLELCNGTCTDTSFDSRNCGSCGNTCPLGKTCLNGKCLCPADLAFCNGTCVDLGGDEFNCGTCAKTCPPDKTCISGACSDRPANICVEGYCSYPLSFES